MSAKVFTKQELLDIHVISLPKAYQRADQIPIDPSTIFASLADAQEYVDGESVYGDIAYAGQIVSVADAIDGVKVYKVDTDGKLVEIGGGSANCFSAQTYSDAVKLASNDTIGSIVNVIYPETISGDTYSSGLYIITGNNSVAKLGISSATGDVEGDVENLKARVATLETTVSEISDACYWIDGDAE